MPFVEVSNFAKYYGDSRIFDQIDFHVDQGEWVTLLGPSGCGKSTLLRAMAGLTDVSAGSIKIEGEDLTHTAPQKRGIGMVFQSYALFPNLSVAENIAFGLKMQRCQGEELRRRVADVMTLVELGGKEHHYPHQLSGGQSQRVALARALVVEPRILLLDEPLSALDARIRKHLREQLREIQTRLHLTTVFVTHDQEEAMTLSDRIFVMNQGRIVQHGTADIVYTQPATEFVARFMGSYNLLDAEQSQRLFGRSVRGHLALRPEAITLLSPDSQETDSHEATVLARQLLGNVIRYQVESQGTVLLVDRLNPGSHGLLENGARIKLQIRAHDLREVS
jgi:putative spermidine/putrescine transport system ATP-binding protein